MKLTNICHKNVVDVLDTGPTTTLTEITWENDVFLFYIWPKWKKDIKKHLIEENDQKGICVLEKIDQIYQFLGVKDL